VNIPIRLKLQSIRLYALLTEERCVNPWRRTAEALLAGGVDALQLREKHLTDSELLRRARLLRQMTTEADALFIVNDRPDIAVLSGADGVHLGQDDLPARAARRIVGPDLVVGLSTHTVQQAEDAVEAGADYIGVGPVAATETRGYAEGKGIELVRRVCSRARLPAVAIGGITEQNARAALNAGASGVALCSALCGAQYPELAARRLRAAISRSG